MRLLFTLATFCLIVTLKAKAQKDEFVDKDFNNAILIAPAFTAQFPFADMQKRFGYNSQIGGSLSYQFRKHWHIGAEGGFIFGRRIKEDSILDRITTTQGSMISFQDGTLVNVGLQQRGFCAKVIVGKTVVFSKNPRNHSGQFYTG